MRIIKCWWKRAGEEGDFEDMRKRELTEQGYWGGGRNGYVSLRQKNYTKAYFSLMGRPSTLYMCAMERQITRRTEGEWQMLLMIQIF